MSACSRTARLSERRWVSTAPSAFFTIGCNQLACSADASGSRDPDGSIVSYAWSFGDGAFGNGSRASHAYGAAGSYTVTLTVRALACFNTFDNAP